MHGTGAWLVSLTRIANSRAVRCTNRKRSSCWLYVRGLWTKHRVSQFFPARPGTDIRDRSTTTHGHRRPVGLWWRAFADWFYDSRPQKTAIFFNKRCMAARHEKGCYEKKAIVYCLVCRGLSNDDVEVANGIVVQETRPGDGFKTGDSLKKSWGGATVERIYCVGMPFTDGCREPVPAWLIP